MKSIIPATGNNLTQSGDTVRLLPVAGIMDFTSSYQYYTGSAQVWDMLVYANGSESMVSAVDPNGINLTVSPSYTFSDENTFTIWKTSQKTLHQEIKRSSTYLPNWPNCGNFS